ncbi:uncharacterized protein LOC120522416 [Polypterus senegalus]|uniref:uncharacterized protein LOC120522416 n=1 Tax=Polypterus senegalus TaxID=55291 RepID=UPI0019643237|nr:uncharacterized protein LOC120522416 [Polypterus senegalus]
MLEAFGDATDNMGVPVLDRDKIQEIWKTQRRHLHCIQDPPGVHLYMQTGQLVKGGITLPVFRCARGSTSLESFHLHLDRFIPGTSASAAHFQAYLLEGLTRWNEDRAAQAVEGADRDMVCYSGQLQHSTNELSEIVYHRKLVVDYTRPAKYTGELIGIQYLFSQTGRVLEEVMGRDPDAPDGTDTDDDDSVDEGFQEVEGLEEEALDNTVFGLEEDFAQQPLSSVRSQSHPAIGASQSGPADQETSPGDEATQSRSHKLHSLGTDTDPGYQHVVNLALSLVKLRHHAYVTQQQVADIVTLWERLPEGDKAPVRFPPRYQERLVQGRFRRKHSQTIVTPGVESLRWCMGGQATQMPNISRLVEAVCVELSRIHPEGTTICGVRVNRWAAVMRDYICIRENILTNSVLLAQTRIQLFPLNQRTLAQWHYARTRELQRRDLELAVPLPTSSALATEPTPAARPRPTGPEQSAAQPLHFLTHLTYPFRRRSDAGPSVPRTTAWRRKKKQEADELARQQGILPKQRKKIEEYICKSCGRQKTKEFGHSQFGGEFFCSTSAGKTIEEWLEEKRREKQKQLRINSFLVSVTMAATSIPTLNPVPQFRRETSGELTLKASGGPGRQGKPPERLCAVQGEVGRDGQGAGQEARRGRSGDPGTPSWCAAPASSSLDSIGARPLNGC